MKHKIIMSLILFILITPEVQAQAKFRYKSQTKDNPKQRSQEEIERAREINRLNEKEHERKLKQEERDRKKFYEETAREEERRRIEEGERESRRLESEQLRKEREDGIKAREREERELKQRKQEMEERAKREQAYKEAEERRKEQREAEERERKQNEDIKRERERLRRAQMEAEAEIFKAQEESRNQRREAETKAREQNIQSKMNQDPMFADVYNGMMLANSAKFGASEYIASHGKWPERNSDLGLPDEYYIEFVQINVLPENAIEIKFKTKELMDKTVELHVRVDNGIFIWECSGGTLEKEHRPKECVN